MKNLGVIFFCLFEEKIPMGDRNSSNDRYRDNILNDGELDVTRTVKEFLTVRQEGNLLWG